MGESTFPYDEARVRQVMDSVANADRGWMYADAYCDRLYGRQGDSARLCGDTLFWVGPWGLTECAETLLSWLRDVEKEGLKRESFHVDEIEADVRQFRTLKPDSCTEEEVCLLYGRLEQRLTNAYLRYAFGQRFGYTRPYRIFSNILGSKGRDVPNRLFDFECDVPTDSFALAALHHLQSVDDINLLLESVQPTDSLFRIMRSEYQRASRAGERSRTELARLNLERSRWRYARPTDEEKYVWINIPSYMLRAVNRNQTQPLVMRICCGRSDGHQTPLLHSQINRLELNPYWTVPTSIVKKEMAPAHAGDSSYFARNRMVAIDHQTKAELNAASLSYAQLLSGRYTIRQDRGAGNSLGRLIFRFPNDYSVYLHDTNSPSAFKKESRAVSHGCVRVQQPLELATFLMDDPDELLVDKIRVAIGREPLTERGVKYRNEVSEEKYMKSYAYNPSVPVFIDYYTLYPDCDGELMSFPDVYGYDEALKKVLDQF